VVSTASIDVPRSVSGLRRNSSLDKIKSPNTKLTASVTAMATVTTNPDSDLAILSRLIRPERHGLSASAACAILKIDFEASDRERMNVLAEKARSGTLTPQERAAIDNYERVGHLLDLIHAKARQSLRKRKGAAPRPDHE
jgi:hypothetical protein